MTVRPLTAHDILRLWESCANLHPADRGPAVLGAAWPSESPEALAGLPLGERERRTVALRVGTFGRRAVGACDCPSCGEIHEVDPPLEAILAAPEAPRDAMTLDIGDYTFMARLPNSRDQAALTHCRDAEEALLTLITRCVISASCKGECVDVRTLPAGMVERLADGLAERDPNAETLLALTCCRCGHQWTLVFDAEEFLWRELAARARRLIYEVHVLAHNYGWHEVDILEMSSSRREAYLELVGR